LDNAVHSSYYDHNERESRSRTFLVWKVAIFEFVFAVQALYLPAVTTNTMQNVPGGN